MVIGTLFMSLLAVTGVGVSPTADTGIPHLGGCRAIRATDNRHLCRFALDADTLTVWWPTTRVSEIAVSLDEQPLSLDRALQIDGGLQLRVPVGAGTRTLRLAAGEWSQEWRLAPISHDPLTRTAERLLELGVPDKGKLRREVRRLEVATFGHDTSPVKARRLSALARLYWSLEDVPRARELARRSSELFHMHGEVKEAARDLQMLAYLAIGAGELAEAREALAASRALSEPFGEMVALQASVEARYFEIAGDLRSAYHALATSVTWARRLEWSELLALVAPVLADHEILHGRIDRGAALLDEAEAMLRTGEECYVPFLENARGWQKLRIGEIREDDRLVENARQHFLDAYRLGQVQRCNTGEEDELRLNLAHATLALGEPRAAESLMPDPQTLKHLPVDSQAWYWLDIGRIELLRGHSTSGRSLLSALAEQDDAPLEVRWLAAHYQARALERAGDLAAATAAYREGERLLDRWAEVSPHTLKRGWMVSDPRKNGGYLVDLLLRQGEPDEAACAARLARRRARQVELAAQLPAESPTLQAEHARNLAARDRLAARFAEASSDDRPYIEAAVAQLEETLQSAHVARRLPMEQQTCTALRPPEDDETILLYHPLPRERWAGFAISKAGTAHDTWERGALTGGPPAWSAVLLAGLGGAIVGSRLRVIASGVVDLIPVHALPWSENTRVVDHFEVAYSLDRQRPRGVDADPSLAVVVGDPLDGLPSAQEERKMLATRLADRGWEVVDADDVETVLEALRTSPRPTLLMYNSHGTLEGAGYWKTGHRLLPADLLFVTPPRVAIVASCYSWLPTGPDAPSGCGEFGLTDALTAPGAEIVGLGFADALLTAGAESVIATQGEICDADARDVLEQMFDHSPDLESFELGRMLQRAQQRAARYAPRSDWWRIRHTTY